MYNNQIAKSIFFSVMMYSQNLILEDNFVSVLEVSADNLAKLKLMGVLPLIFRRQGFHPKYLSYGHKSHL